MNADIVVLIIKLFIVCSLYCLLKSVCAYTYLNTYILYVEFIDNFISTSIWNCISIGLWKIKLTN